MKTVLASVGLIALGAVSVQTVRADWAAGADKPWTISATLRGFYDDNYNTEPAGNLRRDSYGVEIRPQIAVKTAFGPTTLSASYTYSNKYYEDRRSSDQSHDIELALNHAFNERYTMDLEESFVIAQEPQVLQGGTPLRSNGDNFRNSVSLNFNAQITKLFGLLVGFSDNYIDYTGGQPPNALANIPSYRTSLNRFEDTITLNTRWQVQPETVAIFGYSLLSVDYIGGGNLEPALGNPPLTVPATPPIIVSPKVRNNYTHNIYVGVEHSFRSDLSFAGRAGVQISDYYNAQNDPAGAQNVGDVGPFADLSLTYAYMDTGSLTVGFRQSKNQTDVAAPAVGQGVTQDQESSTLYATVNQVLTPLSPKLSASLTGQFQNSVYNGGGANNLTDTFYLVGLNLTYQFTQYLSAEVGYNYDLLQSDIGGRGYDRNRVYIGVTASY